MIINQQHKRFSFVTDPFISWREELFEKTSVVRFQIIYLPYWLE